MKRIVLGLVVVLAAGLIASAQSVPDATKAIVNSYLELQGHLAADRFDQLKSPARTLAEQARALGQAGDAIAKAATALETAADVKAAREAFGPLSDAVIVWVQSGGSKEAAADLRLAYCPMVKRSWLQREDQIRNPYYGKQMATCGEFKPLKK